MHNYMYLKLSFPTLLSWIGAFHPHAWLFGFWPPCLPCHLHGRVIVATWGHFPHRLPWPALHVASWENKSACWHVSEILHQHVSITALLYILRCLWSTYCKLSWCYCCCVTAAPGEARRHSWILKASCWKCVEEPKSAQMWFFATAVTGE